MVVLGCERFNCVFLKEYTITIPGHYTIKTNQRLSSALKVQCDKIFFYP